eukprot:214811_1
MSLWNRKYISRFNSRLKIPKFKQESMKITNSITKRYKRGAKTDVRKKSKNNKTLKEQVIINDNATNCEQLVRLKYALDQFYDNKLPTSIMEVVNDFFHLLQFSGNDETFEYIYNFLGGKCPSNVCNIFKRHHRDRSKDQLKESYAFLTQIM